MVGYHNGAARVVIMVKQSTAISNALEVFVTRLSIQVTTRVANELFRTTPLKTGFARENWIPSKSVPFSENLVGLVGTPTSVAKSASDRARGLSSIKTYRLRDGPLYITNNVDYISTLNGGSSTQAPPSFVQKSIARELASLTRT